MTLSPSSTMPLDFARTVLHVLGSSQGRASPSEPGTPEQIPGAFAGFNFYPPMWNIQMLIRQEVHAVLFAVATEVSKAVASTEASAETPEPISKEFLNTFDEIELDDHDASQAAQGWEFREENISGVASRIRAIMEEKNINQGELAELIGVNPTVVSKVLKSPEKSKLTTLARMARALNVSLSLFFDDIN